MAVSWRSWLANEGVKHLCLLIWLSLNVLLFWKTFLLYNQGPEYHYLHQMLGCPTETKATFGIHFKIVGDWTERFRDLLLPPSSQDSEILPFIQSRNYPKDDWKPYKLRRLYFIWVCRDIQSFRWFADLLCVLHNKFWHENRPDYVNIQLYLSQTDGIQNIIGEKYQALNSRLFIGRPRWKLLFDEIAKCNRGKTVGVFCCGPSSISKILHKLSNRNNSYGTRFEYNKESFS
uniref:NADPH oxidase 4 n=1 Tax=Rousettus aegyptiacus TaxID=9407 RepID=A0A7J8H2Z0_ROUAE|nr:NADPH oxidase 4 [Rousettus aegyptiacus]